MLSKNKTVSKYKIMKKIKCILYIKHEGFDLFAALKYLN